MFPSISMASHAVLKIGDALFAVFTGDIPFVMLMTAVTSISSQADRMAGLATPVTSAMIHWEGMRTVV